MIEMILGALVMVNVYLFIQWRNERKARHNQVERLERFFFSRVEAEKARIADQNKSITSQLRIIHNRITAITKEKEQEK